MAVALSAVSLDFAAVVALRADNPFVGGGQIEGIFASPVGLYFDPALAVAVVAGDFNQPASGALSANERVGWHPIGQAVSAHR